MLKIVVMTTRTRLAFFKYRATPEAAIPTTMSTMNSAFVTPLITSAASSNVADMFKCAAKTMLMSASSDRERRLWNTGEVWIAKQALRSRPSGRRGRRYSRVLTTLRWISFAAKDAKKQKERKNDATWAKQKRKDFGYQPTGADRG